MRAHRVTVEPETPKRRATSARERNSGSGEEVSALGLAALMGFDTTISPEAPDAV